MPTFALRPVTAEDADFIYSTYEVTLRPLVEGIGRRWAESRMREKSAAESNDGRTQIVIVRSECAGFINIEERPAEVWLHALFLIPEFQRAGLGRALLQVALDKANSLSLPVRCQVMSFNPAIGFYERLGFKVYGEVDSTVLMQNSETSLASAHNRV